VTTQGGVTFLVFTEALEQPELPVEGDKLDQILARLDLIIAMLKQMG